MCRLLVDQFTSIFTIPDLQQIITDPVSFFVHEPNIGINKSLFLTDIMLIEAIHELSPNSAAGPDCVPLLVNCATEIAPVLLLIFPTLFPMELSPKLGSVSVPRHDGFLVDMVNDGF